MENTIGKLMGVISHVLSVTNSNGDTVQFTIKIDFRSATDDQCKGFGVSNRIIAGQRPWRSLSAKELRALDNQTFIAQDIGKKVKSRAEKLQVYTQAGMNEVEAEFALDNPDKFKAIMAEVMNKAKDVEEEEDVDVE